MTTKGKLVFLTGKMGSGKSTYAIRYSTETDAVILSEDQILSSLFPDEIKSIEDYIKYSIKIKPFILSVVESYINHGINVVMDFPGNTVRQREWFKNIIQKTKAEHTLVYIKVTDEICLKQLEKRRKECPERHQFDTKEVFYKMKEYCQEPNESEGFNLRIIC